MTTRATFLRVTVCAALSCAVALAQPLPTPAPTEAPGDDDGPVVTEDAGAAMWSVVPLVAPSTVVVCGRGVQITAGEVMARLRDTSGALEEGYATSPALTQELVDRMVADRLLADEARRRGLENDPIVRATVERALVSRLRALVINPAVDATRPDDAEVRAWYEAHIERFHIPERRRARVVFVPTRREALEVLRLATARRRGRYVHDFRDLAEQHNSDPHLRSMAGDLRDVTPTPFTGGLELDPAVRAALFEIANEGDTLPRVIEGHWHDTHGYFLVHLTSRRRGEERTLAAQSDWIRLRIMLERRVNAERDQVATLTRDRGVTALPLQGVLRFDRACLPDAGLGVDSGVDASP